MAEPDCFHRYRMRCNAEFYYIRRENPTYRNLELGCTDAEFKMVLFTASRRNNFIGGTCALSSARLVLLVTSASDLPLLTIKFIMYSTKRRSPFFAQTVTQYASVNLLYDSKRRRVRRREQNRI